MRRTIPLLLALSVVSVAGCFIETTENPPTRVVSDGTLTLRWQINRTVDPNQCFQGSAERIRVFAVQADGFRREYVARCQDFATTITLPQGTYTGEAFLEGPAGRRTTSVTLGQVPIISGRNVVVEVDFPSNSFL